MTFAESRGASFAFGANCEPPADLVGGFVFGSLDAPRQVVEAEKLFRAYAENELPDAIDPTRESYSTVFAFSRTEFVEHVRRAGSPKGYAGPAACCRALWDIYRAGNLDAALADARKLARFLAERYPELAERGLSVAFSGSKGFHVSLLAVPGFDALPHVPRIVRKLALAVAGAAGVRVDETIYGHQSLIRLPNSRHAKTGLYKRVLDLDDLDALTVAAILDAAKHPSGVTVRYPESGCEQLATDWEEAERAALADNALSSTGRRMAPSGAPVVPKFVRDFIGFGDIQEPGRALTLFRCAAALAEAGTPRSVIHGLLEEPAVKIGLDADEVVKQINAGFAHGARQPTGRGATA